MSSIRAGPSSPHSTTCMPWRKRIGTRYEPEYEKWLPAVIRLQLTLESAVLVGERQGTSLSPPRGHLHIQSQSRRRGLSHHVVDSGRIHPNLCYNRNHPDVLTCLGFNTFRKQHGILRRKVRQSVNQSSTAISEEGTVTDHEYVAVHLTKCLAKSQGPKVRVNAVCPGLLLTEWVGTRIPEMLSKSRNRRC